MTQPWDPLADGPLLQRLLDALLPASADGRLPAGSAVGFLEMLEQQGEWGWLCAELQPVRQSCADAMMEGRGALSALDPQALLERLKSQHFTFLNALSKKLMHCYYQDGRVMQAIGLEARAPFPMGYHVEEGDWSLLEAVYDRGELYRKP